jgi:DNA-binding beta-propeller fold protein YncE
VVLLDGSGAVVRRIPASQIHQPYEAHYEQGLFWVFDAGGPAMVAIDPRTGRIARHLRSPISDVGSYVVTHDALWITDERHGTVVAIDPHDGRTLHTFRHLPGRGGSVGVALVHHALWVARPEALNGRGILAVLDPQTGQVIHQIRKLPGSYQLATDTDGTLWTGGTHGAINHINPATRAVAVHNVGGRNFCITVSHHHLWTTDTVSGGVYELDGALPTVIGQYTTAPGADTIAYGDRGAWVGNSLNGTVTEVGAFRHLDDTHAFDHAVTSIAAGDGLIMVGFGKALGQSS